MSCPSCLRMGAYGDTQGLPMEDRMSVQREWKLYNSFVRRESVDVRIIQMVQPIVPHIHTHIRCFQREPGEMGVVTDSWAAGMNGKQISLWCKSFFLWDTDKDKRTQTLATTSGPLDDYLKDKTIETASHVPAGQSLHCIITSSPPGGDVSQSTA